MFTDTGAGKTESIDKRSENTMYLPAKTQKLKIQWLVNAVGVEGETLSLGFCQKNPSRIAFLGPNEGWAVLLPMVVRDLYIDKRGCEERRRCLVLDCPHNQTTFTSYIHSAKWKRRNLPRKANFNNLLRLLKDIEDWLKSGIAGIDWTRDLTYCYEEPTLILHRKPRK